MKSISKYLGVFKIVLIVGAIWYFWNEIKDLFGLGESVGDDSASSHKRLGYDKSAASFTEPELQDKANIIYQSMAPFGSTDFEAIESVLSDCNIHDLNGINVFFGNKKEYSPLTGVGLPNIFGSATASGTLSQWFSGSEFTDAQKARLKQLVLGSRITVN